MPVNLLLFNICKHTASYNKYRFIRIHVIISFQEAYKIEVYCYHDTQKIRIKILNVGCGDYSLHILYLSLSLNQKSLIIVFR